MDAQRYIADFRRRTGRFPSQVEMSKNLGVSPERAIRELVQSTSLPIEKEEEGQPSFSPPALDTAIVVGLLTIAAMTFALSVYFTGLWFRSMFNFYIAGGISLSMVSYMVLSPQAAHYVKGIVKVPLWGTFVIAMVFSMGSTIAGQYNQLTESIDVGEVNDRATVDILRSEEADIQKAIEEDRRQREFHQKTLESLSQTAEDRIENWQYINTERNMVNELGGEIAKNQERLAEVREELRSELRRGSTGATEERVDFYSWLAYLVKSTSKQVEFWVSALPAIFIDIIAALSLNMALKIRSRKG